jgi:aminopeptidase C
MKEDPLYPVFISYLEYRKFNSDLGEMLSNSKVALLKISMSYFTFFKDKFEENELFQDRILEIYKSESRDKKIENIFDGTDR